MQDELSKHREYQTLRLNTLVRIRWLAVMGQTIAVLFVHFVLGFSLPIIPCLLIICASALLNGFLRLRYPANTRWRGQAVALLLAYDILQLAILLYMTGGIQNPFAVLIAVPVVVSAATQRAKDALPLFVLALLLATLLVFYHLPLPWFSSNGLKLALELKAGIWAALVSMMAFTSVYTYRVADESRKLADALAATELVLQREQHFSNLDGLATAAAHELGTPLATISLVAKEMLREIPRDGPLHEDAVLLRSQADRCREILKKISSLSSQEDENIARMNIELFVEELAAPNRDLDIVLDVTLEGPDPAPTTSRNSAILYGFGNLIENALDFAKSRVLISASWDEHQVCFQIEDDGKGFPPGVLERIGDPFISQRNRRHKESGGGLGLGLFIAKNLLERNGAELLFANKSEIGQPGAIVTIKWNRPVFEKRD